jgi:hypothetical protein
LPAERTTLKRPELSLIEAGNRFPKPERDDSPRAYTSRAHLPSSRIGTSGDGNWVNVAAAADLARFAYASDNARMGRYPAAQGQGLVSERTLPVFGRKTLQYWRSRKRESASSKAQGSARNQKIYHGIVKPRAKRRGTLSAFTRAERIQKPAANFLVVLDYELKRNLNRSRATATGEMIRRKWQAWPNGMDSPSWTEIPLPDMRIEYQTVELELQRVDLELATRHYRPRGVATKARRAFPIATRTLRLRRILDERNSPPGFSRYDGHRHPHRDSKAGYTPQKLTFSISSPRIPATSWRVSSSVSPEPTGTTHVLF